MERRQPLKAHDGHNKLTGAGLQGFIDLLEHGLCLAFFSKDQPDHAFLYAVATS